MCIVLLTTAHPDYALIIIDNRDEYILRPTSRPHWWQHPNGASILSSRDLQRAEKGTWLGITKEGVFAILTNFREMTPDDSSHPIHAARSRGGMVTAWLGSGVQESAAESAHHLVKEGGVKGVGGFSMVAGKLRRRKAGDSEESEKLLEPVAIISNRCGHVDDVPWIAEGRGEVYGLSNTSYADPQAWPKVENGKLLLKEIVANAVAKGLSEQQLINELFAILDTDTLPKHPGMSLNDYISELKQSIFVPAIGDAAHRQAMLDAASMGHVEWANDNQKAAEELIIEGRPDSAGIGFETGMYGTQRQTVILVDWDGNVTYHERALWDGNGNPVERGEGDVVFKFKIEGWDL